MTTLMKASNQWASRPNDERYTSLTDMLAHFKHTREHTRCLTAPSRSLTLLPEGGDDPKALVVQGPNGGVVAPTHWAFGQVARLSGAPAGYLSTLPAPIVADCVNYGLRFNRPVEDVGLMLQQNGGNFLTAATGPKYGRVWNADVVGALVKRFGDGTGNEGPWKVPGEFGKAVEITKANTTLFASDRDMFVFLADEENRIELPNRRAGKPGSLARGFFVWNSEVGSASLGVGMFLFDYVCCNRIVWGAENYAEVRVRHSAGAPERFMSQVAPALDNYRKAVDGNITKAITDARQDKIGANANDVNEWLAKRFGKGTVAAMQAVHLAEEERPIETRWDAITAATAVARSLPHQDARVTAEREAGKLLDLTATEVKIAA